MLLIEEGIFRHLLEESYLVIERIYQAHQVRELATGTVLLIDRMANLNIEPGADLFDELISKTEHGVLMKTNTSWSIDDSRNKFQFPANTDS